MRERSFVSVAISILLLASLLPTLSSSSALEEPIGWNADVKLTDSSASLRSDIAVDSNDEIHIVWGDIMDPGGVFYKKFDGEWSDNVSIGPDGAFPGIAIDSSDVIHVAYIKHPPIYPYFDIYYSRYDGSWSTPDRVTYGAGFNVHWSPQLSPDIAVAPNGDIYVAWTHSTDTHSESFDIAYVHYNGTAWSPIQYATVDDRIGYNYQNPKIAIDSQKNRLHLVYEAHIPEYWGCHYQILDDSTWSDFIRIDDGTGRFPVLAIDTLDNAHIAWNDIIVDHVIYSKFDSAGNNVIDNKQITETTNPPIDPLVVNLQLDTFGNVHFTMQGYVSGSGPGECYYIKTNNTGDRVTNVTYLSSNDGDWGSSPRLATDSQNRVHVVFVDNRTGNQDIYYKSTYAEYVHLDVGWNLISVPAEYADKSPSAVLHSIDGDYNAVQWYNPSTGTWDHYSISGEPGLDTLTTIDHSKGLLINITNPTTFMWNNTPLASTDITLYEGWNLVGYPHMIGTMAVYDALNATEINYDRIEGHDGAGFTELGDASLLRPGRGYWIYVPEGEGAQVWSA